MDRDGGAALRLVGPTEDELMRGLVEIVIRDAEHKPFAHRIGVRNAPDDRAQEELLADAVERRLRNVQAGAHDDRVEKTLLET